MASRSIPAAPFAAALLLLVLSCAPSGAASALPGADDASGARPAPAAEQAEASGSTVDGFSASTGVEALSSALAAAASNADALVQTRVEAEQHARELARQAAEKRDKRLGYDPALIEAIGNQTADGHWGCCPGYSCAYGDAIITGQAVDHSAYTCRCCTWPGWGGGNSSFRSLGSNAALLGEAYAEIAAGRPTVVHVAGSSGEHWICLMGYRDVEDAASLSLDNFLALDPVTGSEIVASDGYVLYGDFCEHVSDRR